MNVPISDKILFPADKPDWIPFEYGAPGQDLLPVDILTRATEHQLNREDGWTSLQYGPKFGDKRIRQELAQFLRRGYADEVSWEQLCITNGASQSFSNILTWFTTPETIIFIENPTYFLALRVLEDQGRSSTDFISIPVDSDGIQVDVLASRLARIANKGKIPNVSKKRFPILLYLVPTFSNPTGTTLTGERRRRLVELAYQYNMLVVCDDVYQLLPFPKSAPPPHRLIFYEREYREQHDTKDHELGRIISNGSFSKILGPGLRFGWTEVDVTLMQILDQIALLYSGGCPSHYTSTILATALEQDLIQPHLEYAKSIYFDRSSALYETFAMSSVSNMLALTRPKGGYFIWIEIKGLQEKYGITTSDIMNYLIDGIEKPSQPDTIVDWSLVPRERVSVTPGNAFSCDLSCGDFFRVSFGMHQKSVLVEGALRFIRVLESILSQKS